MLPALVAVGRLGPVVVPRVRGAVRPPAAQETQTRILGGVVCRVPLTPLAVGARVHSRVTTGRTGSGLDTAHVGRGDDSTELKTGSRPR